MENMNTAQADLRYSYEMTLSLARPGAPFSTEDKQAIEQGIACYNEKTIYMANPKRIQLLEISDSYIRIELFSTQILTTPGRGLRTLTTILLNNPQSCFADRVTPGGQLFRVVSIKQPTGGSTLLNPALISDVDFLKAIIDYIFVEKKTGLTVSQKKKAAMEEMKKLAVETGIISSATES